MTQFTKTASVLAALALTVPMVCQAAVDPIGSLAQVKQLTAAGKTEDAITLCDKVLTEFSKKNAVSAQFGWVLPFYAWEKGSIYFKAKDYENAYAAFKAFREDKRWQDPALQAAVKENRKDQPEGIAPFLSNVVFQMGYCRYMQGAGEEEKPNSPAKPGDPAKFDEAITLLEEYLGMLQKGKVSQTEKAQKLDGQICFLLLQANLLKPTPDFQKASQYLDLSRTVKGKVPDEMAMNGLATIINVAMKDPKNVGWVHKIIGASPASYKLEPARSGRSANKFLNYGIRASRLADTALKDNDMEVAQEAVRSANVLFGLVPDVADVRADISTQSKAIGKYTKPIVDRGTGSKLTKDSMDKLSESYKKIAEDKMNLEAFAILSTANTALAMGSNRLGKAGYQILFDRYRDLQNKTKDGVKAMKNDNIFQLAQLCYATGDEAAGANYDQMLDGEDMGDRGKNIAYNKLARIVKDQRWEEVEPAAQEVMQAYASDVTHKCYVLAQFYTLSANYKLKEYAKVVEAGNALLKGGTLVAGKEKNSLKADEVNKLQGQAYYFVMDSYSKLAAQDVKNYDKALTAFEEFKTALPSLDLKENALAPNAYYTAVDVLLKQAGISTDEAAAEKLQQRALELLAVITANWKEHDLYPNAELLTGSIIINGKDDAVKDTAIAALERCADAALKLKDGKGKTTAANALYWLGSYTPEIERAGETEEARNARVLSFAERFWAEADAPGNAFSLQEISLELGRVSDKDSFEKTTQHARDIIAREATYALEHETANPELEKTINTYVEAYVTGTKKYLDKELTLEEKAEHFNNFPGISPEDKYARAIFRMAFINSMNTALSALKDNPEAKTALQNDIEKTFREMTNTFKPADLTSFICVNVGDYLVNYVGRFDDPSSKQAEIDLAVSYYDAVIERNKEADLVAASELGKANALSFSKDTAQQKIAEGLYNKVVATNDPNVVGAAQVGLTKMYMRTGDYASAVKAASAYMQFRGGDKRERLGVMMMLGEAYNRSGDAKNALLTYMNLYNQNKGQILYSAPACKAMMEIMWKRNEPAKGDRLKGDFKHSDRWMAWTTGQKYVDLVVNGGIEAKLTPAERDEFNKVKADLATYAADASVQKEDKADKDFQRKLQKK